MTPRVAVIGAGIAGLSAAWMLRHRYDVTVFEAEPRTGGHADTQTVEFDRQSIDVDTSFIGYNPRNSPNLSALFAELGVATQPSDMSFGVSIDDGALEYGGGTLARLFAQPGNSLRPRFWSMLRDMRRFYRAAPALLQTDSLETLGEFLDRAGYGAAFAEDHILPIGAAICRTSVDAMRAFPARTFARFLEAGGLLSPRERPAWRTVTGGSRRYVARLARDLPDLRLACPALGVARGADGVIVRTDRGETMFDQVVFACHADTALALLAAPTAREAAALGAIRFQDNEAVLHTDTRFLPQRRAAWSARNYLARTRAYRSGAQRSETVSVTCWMNRLQGMATRTPLLLTVNPLTAPDAEKVLRRILYRHPQFDTAAMQAQAALHAINGRDRIWFAGAWIGWGFHEDGITSAARIAASLGCAPIWAQPKGRSL